MKNINNIALWVLFGVSLVMLGLFAFADTESVQLTTGQYTDVSTQLDSFIWWVMAVVGIALILLVVFAIKTMISDIKAAAGALIGVGLFVGLLVVCYFISPASEDLVRVVNGETEVITVSWLKIIDMWINSIVALIGLVALLIVGFAIKNNILKK